MVPDVSLETRGWPAAMTASPEGHLTFDGCDLLELAQTRGTPLWAISRSTIEENFKRLRSAFQARYPKCEIAFSIKSNNTLAVIRLLHNLGAKLDCHPEYEYQFALAAGVPPSDIILNGNGKSDAALRAAAQLGVRQVNIDSVTEVHRLNGIAREFHTRVNCVVRVKPPYKHLLSQDPNYDWMLTRGAAGKTGLSISSGQAEEAVAEIINSTNLDFRGIHHHNGFGGYIVGGEYSPERELMHHRETTLEICEFANAITRRYGVQLDRLDLGGGWRTGSEIVLSTPGDGRDVAFHPVPTSAEYAEVVIGTIETHLDVSEPPLVQLESGGHQMADAGVLLGTICEVKDIVEPRRCRFIVPDVHMLMFVTRGMSAMGHPVVPVERPLAPVVDDWPVEVVGQTCMHDPIAEEIRLPDLKAGNALAILHQGAYCEVMSTQMNGFPRPEVVLLDKGKVTLVKRRETVADIYGRNIMPPDLWAGD